jgi:hypothetical protein
MRERAFGPLERSGLRPFGTVGPSALRNGRAFGPSLSGARSATRLQNIQSEIPTKIHFPGDPKMAAKFVILGDRHKRYFERPKKVHFWKIHFQNLFQKSKNSNFAAIFVYIEFINGSRYVTKIYYNM